jgi:1-acyl-sn-glycerol-3-phosphate acyltransferase
MSISVLFATLIFVAVGFPVLLVASLLHDIVSYRRWATTRALFFLTGLLAMECIGVLWSLAIWLTHVMRPNEELYLERNYRLQDWWGGQIARLGIHLYRLKIHVESEFQPEPNPFVLFVRHTSFADTFLPLVLVSSPHRIRLRYVLKSELLWDPCLDIVGNRIPNAFVTRTREESKSDIDLIRGLGRDLATNEGVVLYPEGTRFTTEKLHRIQSRLKGRNDSVSKTLSGLTSVLPPKFGGALALLENGNLDAVFCGHDGLQSTRSLRQLLSGGLIGATIRMRFWRISRRDLPSDPEKFREWFAEEWLKVDRWISGIDLQGQ